MKTAYSINETSHAAGVTRHTLLYHHEWCGLPEPERVGTRRFYSEEDLERIKAYFQSRKPYDRKAKNHVD